MWIDGKGHTFDIAAVTVTNGTAAEGSAIDEQALAAAKVVAVAKGHDALIGKDESITATCG